jgi:hypothetical protein
MAALLAASDEQFRQLKYGDVIEGTIMRKDPDEILVDIGSKSEGVIPNNELQSLTDEERTSGPEAVSDSVSGWFSASSNLCSIGLVRQTQGVSSYCPEAADVCKSPNSGVLSGFGVFTSNWSVTLL